MSDYDRENHRGRFDLDDDEYRRMRQSEDGLFEASEGSDMHDEADFENLSDFYHVEEAFSTADESNGPTYTTQDFLVFLPGKVIRIAQDSHLSWLILFYFLPKEFVSQRPAYLELPRRVDEILNNEKYVKMIDTDQFDELVWDCYHFAIWQALKVPDGHGGYKDIPGSSKCYSGDFPLWRLGYQIIGFFRRSFETELEFSFQRYFTAPPGLYATWMSMRHFSNLIMNLTDRIVEQENLQPVIDAIWENRQPEDYTGSNLRTSDFLRSWQHSRNHPHYSVEQLIADGFDTADPRATFDQKVEADIQVEQFAARLTDRDRKILEMRMQGTKLEDIALSVGYKTAGAVKKRIDKIADDYEKFSNPPPT